MTYRLKHRHEIVWLTEAMTIVTAWKKQRWSNQMVPAKWITGKPGMALVITHLPGGKQQQRFASRAEVAEHFEEEMPQAPEHVQGETTTVGAWHAWPDPAIYNPKGTPAEIRLWQEWHTYPWPSYRVISGDSSVPNFYLNPPEAPKAL